MGLIADTSVFILAERAGLENPLAGLPDNEAAAISAITVSELLLGVHLATRPDRAVWRQQRVELIMSSLRIVAFDGNIARVYAQLSANLRRNGLSVGIHDLIIAATAMQLGWVVITANIEEFRRIEGLRVVGV